MIVEIISGSASTKIWDQAGIELATPGSAVRLASVARHVNDCAMRPGQYVKIEKFNIKIILPYAHLEFNVHVSRIYFVFAHSQG